MSAVAVLVAVLVVVVLYVLLYYRSNSDEPPWMPYLLPWLGSAIEFGKAPLLYIDYARQKVVFVCVFLCSSVH